MARAVSQRSVMVCYGDAAIIRDKMIDHGANKQPANKQPANQQPASERSANLSPAPTAAAQLTPALVAKLTAIVSRITEIPSNDIDSDEPLENVGLDSIMVTRLNSALEKDRGETLPKTLL